MKLLYIANIRIPTEKAHGIQVMKMCEAFAMHGIEVELVLPQRKDTIGVDPFVYHGVKPIFTITKIPTFDILGFGKFGFYLQLITYIISLQCFLIWKKLFGRIKDTIIYVRGEPVLFLNITARFFFPVFWETHIKPPRYLPLYLRSMNLVRGVITVTDYYKKELEQIYKIKPKVLWTPDAVSIDQVDISLTTTEARKVLGFPIDKSIVLYTGSFYVYDYKGVDVLIESSKYLPKDFLTVLVGGSQSDIEKITGSDVDLSNIRLISHVKHTDIPMYLRSADVLVLPNKKGDEISEKYTSPLKLFEYMAAKKPIVSSDTTCLKEILNDSNAYLFEASNTERLAQSIVEATQSTEKSNRLVEKAFHDVLGLTWEKRAMVIIDFIREQMKI